MVQCTVLPSYVPRSYTYPPVYCTLGCSDFDFFSHFEVKPPIPDTLRVQGFGNCQKKISTSGAWPAEIFGKNRKMRFFVVISKFNFRSPV